MRNPRRTTYKQRRAGAGIGGHMTKQIRAAQNASTKPKETQVALGLADAVTRKASLEHKLAMKKALDKRKGSR